MKIRFGLAPRVAFASAIVAMGLLAARPTQAEDVKCRSTNPAEWPAASKPYFMVIVDTSGSMLSCTNPANSTTDWPYSCPSDATKNSCGLEPTRLNDAKCALRKTVQAFGGQVNFGLATFGQRLSGCRDEVAVDSCPNRQCDPPDALGTEGEFYQGNGCSVSNPPGGDRCGTTASCAGTGPVLPNLQKGWTNGGNILVPLPKDPTWGDPAPASNVPEMLRYFDGRTTDSKEIFALGNTPLGGALNTVNQYLRSGWNAAWSPTNYCASGFAFGPGLATPIDTKDRACRSVNVILVTDGDETCGGDAKASAKAMFDGLTIGPNSFKVRTNVIGFAGASQADIDAIATAGGGKALTANNETTLATALSDIIAGAIPSEVCDNVDNNCNGCTDEGSKTYCNRGRTAVANPTQANQCCQWSTLAQQKACVAGHASTITAANPKGDLFRLPCMNPSSLNGALIEQQWLCTDPGEVCDEQDNNCDVTPVPSEVGFNAQQVDESFNKCANKKNDATKYCPVAETCDGLDQDCDSIPDNTTGSSTPYGICPNQCVTQPETCNGCDDDCDGIADNGITAGSCGPPVDPSINPKCGGVLTCAPPENVGVKGCKAGGPGNFFTCTFPNKTVETCNGQDDDCDGIIDNLPNANEDCVPAGLENLNYGPNSRCKKGKKSGCNASCIGFVGPGPEVCNAIDDDCDGNVDEPTEPNGAVMPGLGLACGIATPPCSQGTTACVNGSILCQGGSAPQPEICDGIDNNCNGAVDEPAALTDAPAPEDAGCWPNDASSCATVCTYVGASPTKGASWCPPAGADCKGNGALTEPCFAGKLSCKEGAWSCSGGKQPATEVCDGVDNDCNGTTDTDAATVGVSCGLSTDPSKPWFPGWPAGSTCTSGIVVCTNGVNACIGANGQPTVGPSAEICDGKDNDCDGETDEGIAASDVACAAAYDKTLYPGDRSLGACRVGKEQCAPIGSGGNGGAGGGASGIVCVGAVGPTPEVCDGIDNDCDGQVDEVGPAPDGINGTANPKDPTQLIGADCGLSAGVCAEGKYECSSGAFACPKGNGEKKEEVCDCLDNDCDGKVDEDGVDANGATVPICGAGKACAKIGGSCQCVVRCTTGEFPCPVGSNLTCQTITQSGTDAQLTGYCAGTATSGCGGKDCAKETVADAKGVVECAPAGTADKTPVCVCKGDDTKCHAPCFGVAACETGFVCANFGADAGKCVKNDCRNVPCPTGLLCNQGGCVADPCATKQCAADEVCRSIDNFKSAICTKSCADVTCAAGEACKDGVCAPTGCGATGCKAGEVCVPAGSGGGAGSAGAGGANAGAGGAAAGASGAGAKAGSAGAAGGVAGTCVPSKCGMTTCGAFEACDPVTGSCGNDPCEGVKCPTGQSCNAGQCQKGTGGKGGAGGGTGGANAGGKSGAGQTGGNGPSAGAAGNTAGGTAGNGTANGGSGNVGPGTPDNAKIGLASGGGGCTVADGESKSHAALALLGMVAALATSRRRASKGGAK